VTLRWDPDDPRWATTAPDLALVDLQVLRQVGIPESILFLAMRRARAVDVPGGGPSMLGRDDSGIPFDDVDECEPDPLACFDRRDYRRW